MPGVRLDKLKLGADILRIDLVAVREMFDQFRQSGQDKDLLRPKPRLALLLMQHPYALFGQRWGLQRAVRCLAEAKLAQV